MKNKNLFAILAMLVMACLAFAGCNNSSDDDDPAVATVIFDANGHGTAPAAATVAVGSKLTKPADPAAEGYSFGGWYKEKDCTNAWDFDNETVAAATTLYAKWSMQCLPGTFSVAADKTVHFATGNMVATYNGTSYTWSFAPHQYYYVGNAAGNTSINSQSDGAEVDLFGWSTSANNYGISTSTDSNSYFGDFVDWGNIESLPGNSATTKIWRTLSTGEWAYLLNTRTDANRFAKANVNGVNGLIIFPDGYNGITSVDGIAEVNSTSASYPTSSIEDATWTGMESAGCAFLPAAGYRSGSDMGSTGSYGSYWSSSPYSNSENAYCVDFSSSYVKASYDSCRYYGQSVRLVCNVTD